MRSAILAPALVLITCLASSGSGLEALANSPCAAQCGNVLSSTSGEDLVCHDSDYKSAAAGTVFQGCVSCQLTSTYVDPVTKQTDLQWALYNLRYAISYCLFGVPNNTNVESTPCTTSTACLPLAPGFEFDSLSPNASEYSYCALMPSVQFPKCNACLSQQSNRFYLTNFVTALEAACQQQPIAGNTISIQGSLFSETAANITSPTTVPTSSYTPSTASLTLGAKIGIAVGAVLFILGLVGFCIVWHGKRRRRNYLRKHQQQTGYADWLATQEAAARKDMSTAGSQGAFFDSPQSARPLVPGQPWGAGHRDEESPASAMGEKVYFSPYSSQYNSPISATDALPGIGHDWPVDRKGFGGSTATGMGGFQARSRSREKRPEKDMDRDGGDRIEMQNVAPVLMHPGHGRSGSGGSGGLTEEDAKKGHAV